MANKSNAHKNAPLYFTYRDKQGVVDRVGPEGVEITFFSWLDGGANGGALLPLSALKEMDLFGSRAAFEASAKAIFASMSEEVAL